MKLPFNFRRKRDTSVLPQEIQEYYNVERRENVGRAWLRTFGFLLIGALLIGGLFMSGRWAYRELASNDDQGSQVQQDPVAPPQTASTATPDKTAAPDVTRSAGSATPPANSTTPSTGDSDELPSTGPADLVGLSAIVVLTSAAAHRLVTQKR